MSIRAAGDDSAKTQVSAVHVRLGEPQAEIVARLDQVVESSHASKDEVQGLSPEAMIDYGVLIFGLWELMARTGLDQIVSPSYNVLVSNVPGPGDKDLYLCGSRMLASYPISTLLPGVNLNATVLSHGNSLDFGLLGDMHALPDLDIVVQRMATRFEELESAVMNQQSHTGAGRASIKKKARRKAGAKHKTSRSHTAAAPKARAKSSGSSGKGRGSRPKARAAASGR